MFVYVIYLKMFFEGFVEGFGVGVLGQLLFNLVFMDNVNISGFWILLNVEKCMLKIFSVEQEF